MLEPPDVTQHNGNFCVLFHRRFTALMMYEALHGDPTGRLAGSQVGSARGHRDFRLAPGARLGRCEADRGARAAERRMNMMMKISACVRMATASVEGPLRSARRRPLIRTLLASRVSLRNACWWDILLQWRNCLRRSHA